MHTHIRTPFMHLARFQAYQNIKLIRTYIHIICIGTAKNAGASTWLDQAAPNHAPRGGI